MSDYFHIMFVPGDKRAPFGKSESGRIRRGERRAAIRAKRAFLSEV